MSSRYSFLNNQDRKLFYKIELNPIEVPDERPKKYKWLSIDSNFKIKPFFVNHKDLAARNVSNSIGFVLSFKLNEEEFKIMFTNDTHLYEEDVIQKDDTNQKNAQQSEKSNLKEILENLISRENPNIFVANINSASFRELLAASGLELNNNHVSFQKLDDCLNKYEDIKKQILYSLGFPKKPSLESIADDNVKWDRLYKSRELGEHLCLWGTKELFEIFKKSSKGPKLFLIGETNEEMGNFRHKIAKELNKKSNLPCLTLDIGVCIKANHEKILARCSLCELDNDEETKFHELDKIKEVCVKFEEEGLFHFCKNHDPGKNNKFIERLERFQPLRHVDMRLK